MALDLEYFMGAMAKFGGPAKATHFAVEIMLPPSLVGTDSDSAKALSVMCESTSLPGVQIGLDDNNRPYGYGPTQKMPWGVIFSDINLTFFADNKGFISSFFTKWLNSIVLFNVNDPINTAGTRGYFVNYSSEYSTTVKINFYDPKNRQILTYTLHECFPTAVYDQNVSWGAQNDILKIPVRFTFTRWTMERADVDQQGDSIEKIRNATADILNGARVDNELTGRLGSLPTRSFSQPVRSFIDTYKRALSRLGGRDYFN